jgi:3-hydroxybutyryl-CoA dehydrogenase
MKIKRVGVVGCGLMGSGIAQVCAQSGYQVVVSEVNYNLLSKGLVSISSFLTKSVEKGKISQQDKDSTLGRIKGTTNINPKTCVKTMD